MRALAPTPPPPAATVAALRYAAASPRHSCSLLPHRPTFAPQHHPQPQLSPQLAAQLPHSPRCTSASWPRVRTYRQPHLPGRSPLPGAPPATPLPPPRHRHPCPLARCSLGPWSAAYLPPWPVGPCQPTETTQREAVVGVVGLFLLHQARPLLTSPPPCTQTAAVRWLPPVRAPPCPRPSPRPRRASRTSGCTSRSGRCCARCDLAASRVHLACTSRAPPDPTTPPHHILPTVPAPPPFPPSPAPMRPS